MCRSLRGALILPLITAFQWFKTFFLTSWWPLILTCEVGLKTITISGIWRHKWVRGRFLENITVCQMPQSKSLGVTGISLSADRCCGLIALDGAYVLEQVLIYWPTFTGGIFNQGDEVLENAFTEALEQFNGKKGNRLFRSIERLPPKYDSRDVQTAG